MRIHHFTYTNDIFDYPITAIFEENGEINYLGDTSELSDHDYNCAVQKACDIDFTAEQKAVRA